MLINVQGRQDKAICFTIDQNVEFGGHCSLTWRNSFFIFGALREGFVRQIGQLKGTRLTRVGTLEFDHKTGTCGRMGTDIIFLCFHWLQNHLAQNPLEGNMCRIAFDPLGKFEQIQESTHWHKEANIAISDCKYRGPQKLCTTAFFIVQGFSIRAKFFDSRAKIL